MFKCNFSDNLQHWNYIWTCLYQDDIVLLELFIALLPSTLCVLSVLVFANSAFFNRDSSFVDHLCRSKPHIPSIQNVRSVFKLIRKKTYADSFNLTQHIWTAIAFLFHIKKWARYRRLNLFHQLFTFEYNKNTK